MIYEFMYYTCRPSTTICLFPSLFVWRAWRGQPSPYDPATHGWPTLGQCFVGIPTSLYMFRCMHPQRRPTSFNTFAQASFGVITFQDAD